MSNNNSTKKEYICEINEKDSITILEVPYNNSISIKPKILSSKTYKLIPITDYELQNLRLQKESFIIIKIIDKLFFAFIPKNVNIGKQFSIALRSENSKHKCTDCLVLSNKCSKVSDNFLRESVTANSSEEYLNMYYSKRIEKYPFISYGIETVNTTYNCFIVLNCLYCR